MLRLAQPGFTSQRVPSAAGEQVRRPVGVSGARRAALAGWTVQTGGARWIIHRGECVYRNDRRCRPVSPAEARRLVDSGEAGACKSCGAEGIDAPA